MKKVTTDSAVFKSLNDAARFSGLSRSTFTKDVLPNVPHRRVGRRVLVTRSALQRYLEGEDE